MNQKIMKIHRILVLILASALISVSMVLSVYGDESGKCGKELSWSYSLGTLTISGKGDMTDYNDVDTAPWYHLRNEITKINLPEGLTSVGRLAFYECNEIKAISIPNSVRIIDQNAFYRCEKLRFVDMSSSLVTISNGAFYECRSIEVIDLPISLETIGDKSFYLCESLLSVTIPEYVKYLGAEAFAYCKALMRVDIKGNLTSLSEWLFYGCESLSEISLPQILTSIDEYAFKRCDSLESIYYSGDDKNLSNIKSDIISDLPQIDSSIYIGTGSLTNITSSSDSVHDEEGKVISQTNSTVTVEKDVTLVTVVDKEKTEQGSQYNTTIKVTVDGDSWKEATDLVNRELNKVNDDYSVSGNSNKTDITVFVKDTTTVDQTFIKDMAGRDVNVEVITPSGDAWRVDGNVIRPNDVTANINLNYTLSEASPQSTSKLETDFCYKLTFAESSALKTEVLIKLPAKAIRTNAFLYQVEKDGTHTRLQAVAVDNDGNAHFYLASVDKDTEYVVGINVPGESKDDIIIPKELAKDYGAIMRLEQIDYVETGARTLQGMTLGTVILIVIIGLVLVAIVIGAVMFYMNKRKQLKPVR